MRPRRWTAAPLVALLVCGACADGGAPGPAGFRGDALAACRDVVDERDLSTTLAAREASVAVLEAAVTDDELDDPAAVVDALEAHRDALDDGLDRLGEVDPPDDLERAWVVLLDDGRARVAVLADRIDAARLLADGADAEVEPAGGPSDAVAGAVEELGVQGRDCEVVWDATGADEDHRGFVADAAATCAAIVERRVDVGFDDATSRVLEGLATVLDDGELDADDPALLDALEVTSREWGDTLADLDAVAAEDAPDRGAWDDLRSAAADSARRFQARLDAVREGSADDVVEAFERRPSGGGADLEALGLAQRDCRSVTF